MIRVLRAAAVAVGRAIAAALAWAINRQIPSRTKGPRP